MRRFATFGLCALLVGCAAAPRHAALAPADSTQSKGPDAFTALAISALIVLVLIPVLAGQKP